MRTEERIILNSPPPNSQFTDEADISNYAKEAIERFFAAGIIGGYPDASVKPQGKATRAEVAAEMIVPYMKKVTNFYNYLTE